ncbi:hypothetical protein [Scytonema sp. PRP1]|uniref:hypothetical protein n=1 Tax=Scytonema sp. PRP1 TaxID=3120513 RepID=UPI002FD198CA
MEVIYLVQLHIKLVLVAKLLLSERELSNKVSSTQGWLKNQLVATYAVFPP